MCCQDGVTPSHWWRLAWGLLLEVDAKVKIGAPSLPPSRNPSAQLTMQIHPQPTLSSPSPWLPLHDAYSTPAMHDDST